MNRLTWLTTSWALLCSITVGTAINAVAQSSTGTKGPIQWSQPVNQAQIDYTAQLDQLLDKHDFNGLAMKMMNPPDASMVLPILDWAKARILAGGSVIIPLIDARFMWVGGNSSPSARPFLETAAMYALYAFLVTNADGVKCEDRSAPSHHLDTIIIAYRDQFNFIAQMAEDRRNLLIDTAIAMEAKTSSLRGNDNYLCRFGLKETGDSLEKNGPGKELPNRPGDFGKRIAIQNDLDYEPNFLPREQWEKKQADIRAQLAKTALALIEPFKQAQPKTPGANSSETAGAEGTVLRAVQPVYPPLAKQARVQGMVRFKATIAVDGTVESLELISGHPLLVPAAMEAAKQWVYKPPQVNNRPVKMITQIEINFTLEP